MQSKEEKEQTAVYASTEEAKLRDLASRSQRNISFF